MSQNNNKKTKRKQNSESKFKKFQSPVSTKVFYFKYFMKIKVQNIMKALERRLNKNKDKTKYMYKLEYKYVYNIYKSQTINHQRWQSIY